jgi:gamma-tubulin complex component 2
MLLLPIAESAVRVREFIRLHSRYEFGFVSHALCAALKKIMREFDVLIAQLEHKYQQNDLSLQKMMFLLQPSKTTLMMLDRLCQRLLNTVGGHMLDVLHGCMLEQGDNQARDLHHHLLMESSRPFLRMLSLWIFRSVLTEKHALKVLCITMLLLLVVVMCCVCF